MADISKTVAVIFEGVNNTGAALGGVSANLDAIGANSQEAAGKVGQLDGEIETLSRKDDSLDDVVLSLKALAGAIVVKEFIDANVEAEKFNRSMTLIAGSTEAAALEFQYIRDLANTLGINVGAAADAYVQLSAATNGTNLEGQATRDIFEAVTVAMSSLGRSTDDTSGALLAISQIVSKGTVSLEELRGQLGERLPGAFQIAADAVGLTTSELDDLISSGGLAADEFLPKFAAELQKTFGDVRFIDGFAQAQARLENSITNAYQALGDTGLLNLFTAGIEVATVSITGLVSGLTFLGEIAQAVFESFSAGSFEDFGTKFDAALTKAAGSSQKVLDNLTKFEDETEKAGDSAEKTGNLIAQAFDKGAQSAGATEKQTKELDAALKALGIDPKQFKDPLDEILRAFEDLARNPAVTGDQFLAGFTATLDAIGSGPDGINALEQLVVGLDAAQKNGALTTDQYTKALTLLEQKTSGQWQALDRATDSTKKNEEALKKQEEQTRKAAEAADRLRLEYEKLASSERIAQIEANTAIAVAGIQAEADKAVAAFDSIGQSITATADLLGQLFGSAVFDDPISAFDPRFQAVQKQIELENQRRADELLLQKKLVEAQIAEMQARTDSFRNGGGLIKIDGAGLQPHLEAFMWEILKTIQVRVNRDGLGLLLGLT